MPEVYREFQNEQDGYGHACAGKQIVPVQRSEAEERPRR